MAEKKCPFCKEIIQSDAIKCRFCGEWLKNTKREGVAEVDIEALNVSDGLKQKKLDDTWFSVTIFFWIVVSIIIGMSWHPLAGIALFIICLFWRTRKWLPRKRKVAKNNAKTNSLLSKPLKPSTTRRVLGLCFLLFLLMWFFSKFVAETPTKQRNTEIPSTTKEYAEKVALSRQKTVEYFNANSAQILSDARTALTANDYQRTILLTSKYLISGNGELVAIHNEAKSKLAEIQKAKKTEKLLAEIKTVPDSDYEKNKSLYQQLAALNPDNADYQSKVTTYEQKIAENQEKKRIAEERIAAEQKRIQEEEHQQKEAKLKRDLDSFMTVLKTAGIDNSIIDRCSANDNELTIVVTNAWHFQPYQIRFQAAQNLWSLWAKLRSPNDPDKARIELTDYNGNSVGGSRWLAGSLIWVKKE